MIKHKQHIIILFLFIGYFQPISASSFSVEEAANKIIIGDTDIHYSEVLRIIAKYGHQLSPDIKAELQARGFDFSRQIVSSYRPQNLDYYVDEGIFRFHYTLTGVDAVSPLDADNNGVPDYVDLIVTTFANIGVIDFTDMEFVRPPGDGWYTQIDDGGSDHYDVYIFNLETGYYGYVQAEDYAQNNSPITRGDNEFSEDAEEERAMVTFMALRNNYNDFSGVESEIIEVTSAHEFFHAIQLGYDSRDQLWFLEATATWIEDEVFDDINDNYQYLKFWMEIPHVALDKHRSPYWYGSWIFFRYISEHLGGPETIREIFNQSIIDDNSIDNFNLETIDKILKSKGSSFREILNKMSIANYLLTSNSNLTEFNYEEAEQYREYGIEPHIHQSLGINSTNTLIEYLSLIHI